MDVRTDGTYSASRPNLTTGKRSRVRFRGCAAGAAALLTLGLTLSGCGSSSNNSSGNSSNNGSGNGSGNGSSSTGTPRSGGTLTIVANSSFGVADPAQNYTLEEWQLLINTHDGLVQFKRVGGTPGTQIVPDLAES